MWWFNSYLLLVEPRFFFGKVLMTSCLHWLLFLMVHTGNLFDCHIFVFAVGGRHNNPTIEVYPQNHQVSAHKTPHDMSALNNSLHSWNTYLKGEETGTRLSSCEGLELHSTPVKQNGCFYIKEKKTERHLMHIVQKYPTPVWHLRSLRTCTRGRKGDAILHIS